MKKFIVALLFPAIFLVQPLSGQSDSLIFQAAVSDTQDVSVRLFDSDKPLDISLRFDISQYKRKRSDTTYLDAVLTYYTDENDSVSKKIKIRARGEIRRKICDFPPFFLNFRMKDSKDGEFIGINKLKVVPYCKLGYEDYVLREYLIYKLYNVLTENSLRVRLFRINLYNTAKPGKPLKQYGFAIEPVRVFEKRTGSFELKNVKLSRSFIKPEMLDRCAIFNYMIGNTDWSIPNMHNVHLFQQPFSEQPELAMIVPYDFDYSGLINAEYAVPFETLPIKSVKERLYLGSCRSREEFRNALDEFIARKDEFYRTVNDFAYLSDRSKREIIRYLDGFYRLFDKRETIIAILLLECREP